MIHQMRRYCIVAMLFAQVQAMGMNLVSPYNPLLRPDFPTSAQTMQFYLLAETAVGNSAFTHHGHHTNALAMYGQQNALSMLNGFAPESEIGKKRIALDVSDNGVRGHFDVCGTLTVPFAVGFSAAWQFLPGWLFALDIPAYVMKLKDVSWADQTLAENEEDALVRQLLTNNFFQEVADLGCGLHLCDWTRAGLGDTTLLLEWFHHFPQRKQVLKNVTVNWRVGLVLPTGRRQDEDKLLALPFGTDGAVAIPYGVGLDLQLKSHVRFGADVQLTHTFGNTRVRRIKTSKDQTELLLLQKAEAYKDFGLTQQFSMYVQAINFWTGFSTKLSYQYLKHGEDVLSPYCDKFSFQVVNSADSLQDWSLHQIFTHLQYDFSQQFGQEWRVTPPTVVLYGRFPFKGRRSVASSMLGLSVSFAF